jgi:hypothetical protein
MAFIPVNYWKALKMQPTNVAILYLGEQNVSLYDGVA